MRRVRPVSRGLYATRADGAQSGLEGLEFVRESREITLLRRVRGGRPSARGRRRGRDRWRGLADALGSARSVSRRTRPLAARRSMSFDIDGIETAKLCARPAPVAPSSVVTMTERAFSCWIVRSVVSSGASTRGIDRMVIAIDRRSMSERARARGSMRPP